MRLEIFPFHLSKVLHLPRNSEARSYEVLNLARKIILPNLKIWCSKMQPLSGNQRPDLLTSLINMPLVLPLPRKMHLCTSSSNVPRLATLLKLLQNPQVCVLYILTSKCASPQRRAFFRHLNLQRWSQHGVFCTFWLRNVLRATTSCTFSTSQLPKVVREWCVLYILTSKCASRHNGVHFFDIATSNSGPNQWKKHSESRLFYLFAYLHLLSSDSFSSLIFFLLLFSSSSHLCPYCRKFDF